MSGSDFSGGGGASFSDINTCDKLIVNSRVSSPKEEVVTELSVGDKLDVVLDDSGQYPSVRLLYKGSLAGGIATPQTTNLIACIRGGTMYIADVISVNDGEVKVRIKPAASE